MAIVLISFDTISMGEAYVFVNSLEPNKQFFANKKVNKMSLSLRIEFHCGRENGFSSSENRKIALDQSIRSGIGMK